MFQPAGTIENVRKPKEIGATLKISPRNFFGVTCAADRRVWVVVHEVN